MYSKRRKSSLNLNVMNKLPYRSIFWLSFLILQVTPQALLPVLMFVGAAYQTTHQPTVPTTKFQQSYYSAKFYYYNSLNYRRDLTIHSRQSKRDNVHRAPFTHLFMAGGSKALNKQAALRQKLEQAKQQNFEQQQDNRSKTSPLLSDQEISERNDRLRFEELLRKKSGSFSSTDSDDKEYKSRQQEDDEIDAIRSGRDLIFEGDPAPTEIFEELVAIKTENAIGLSGKQRLVPWLRKSVSRQQDYIVVLTDPRMQSVELRETMKVLMNELPNDIKSRLIVINADSPAENRRWLKKVGLSTSSEIDALSQQQQQQQQVRKQELSPLSSPLVEVYSDEKMEFMRTYTALGEQRWTMTMFVIALGRIQKLVRDVDQYNASRTIQNAIDVYVNEIKLVNTPRTTQ